MKIDLYDCHDKLIEFKKARDYIAEGVEDCIRNLPDAIKSYFYVFGHSRSIGMDEKSDLWNRGRYAHPDDIPSERMIWSPQITKPMPQPNSYLFKAKKGTDVIETIWVLPKPELWDEYKPGKMMHDESVWNSINNFKYQFDKLSARDPDISNKDIDDFRRIIHETAIWKRSQDKYCKI